MDELKERHNRVAVKVQKDPDVIKRAMLYLGITGEVTLPRWAEFDSRDGA